MFDEFSHRHTPCFINGIPEYVILTRDSRSSSIIGKEFQFNGTFAPISSIQNGDLVEMEDTYLVTTKRPMTGGDVLCSLLKTNSIIDVFRFGQTFDANDNPVDLNFSSIQTGVKVFAQYVTAKLRQEDIGLLPNTRYILTMQTSVNVRDPQQAGHPDRIVLDGKSYQVDAVDTVKYPNLLHIQLSEDRR